jgi:hypothetical protein
MLTQDISRVLRDPSASNWLKSAMVDSLERDPVEAANDAEILAALLQARAEVILSGEVADQLYFSTASLTE